MTRQTGTTGGPMNASFGASVLPDTSWDVRNRASQSANLWHDSLGAPMRSRRRRGRWGVPRMCSGDLSPGYTFGVDAATDVHWGPMVMGSIGSGSHKFIIGQAKNSGGTGISGATVDCYLTSTSELISTISADSSGNFQAPTPYSGSQHYLTGRGTGVAGATVRTLTPTNSDGT